MIAKEKPKYVPSFVIEDDGPTIADDKGNEYELQPGSKVRFRKDYPWEMALLDIATMATAEYMESVIRILARQVLEHNWTDANGDPYPQASDARAWRQAVLDMYLEERTWLLNRCWEGATTVPNGPKSPS